MVARALFHAWWLTAAVALLVPLAMLAAPSTLGSLPVLGSLPRCSSQVRALRPCRLCGMTVGLRHFGGGRPLRAALAHELAAFAWIACACNGMAASLVGLHRVGRGRLDS
ncbi:MAG: hypothetical protein EXR79_17810 [Myxococcales bacterium]|nr:hypothetical protein [Myxococcales bacterium]